MEFFLKWLIFASVALAATVSPGPAFAFTVRTSIAHGRRAGIISSIGLCIGVAAMVSMVMAGFALILSQSHTLFSLIRYLGAAYLVYVGIKAIQARPARTDNQTNDIPYRAITDRKALMMGVLTNLTNPKGIIYFTAIFSQFITPDMTLGHKIIYALTPVITEVSWFSFVTLVLTNRRMKTAFTRFSHWIERTCGGLMIALGFKLALSKI